MVFEAGGTATSLHNRPATPAVCDPGLTFYPYKSLVSAPTLF